MPEYPLYVAFVWHMHQPYYHDMRTGEIALPWVRLHAAKDYVHMAELASRYPDVHLTINVVPSLLDQVTAWAEGREQDRLVTLAEQDGWTDDEKRLILNLGFSISWDNIIARYPRYRELLDRRPAALADPAAFSAGDYRDLLAWLNLAWIDPNWLANDPELAGLVAKARDFTAADLRTIHAKQRQIAARMLPLYRDLRGRGQLEISVTPYYHPILPLLIDSGSARRASPGLPLPTLLVRAPEDAAGQLAAAVDRYAEVFGTAPAGLYPSEGAVSFELMPLVSAAGFRWLASDEAILARSLGRVFERDGSGLLPAPHALYKAYRVMAGPDLGAAIVFRDHELSDRIGFLYPSFPGRQAAEDLIYRLLEIRSRLNDREHPYLVSIILDGENCWEHYEHNGDIFLSALYEMLTERRASGELAAVTVGEYVAGQGTGGALARLATGSWIGGDLTTWIGDPEHNLAWEALARTRAHLVAHTDPSPAAGDPGDPAGDAGRSPGAPAPAAPAADPPAPETSREPGRDTNAGQSDHHDPSVTPAGPGHDPDLLRAWRALYIAEGSDWFWWYSHRNRSDQDAIFDRLFRNDLAAVYEALGEQAPAWLEQPIYQAPALAGGHAAGGYITPSLGAAAYPGEEWALAAVLQPAGASTGTMQRAGGLIERLFVGHDQHSLYLRLDLRDRLDQYTVRLYLGPPAGQPANQRTTALGGDSGAGGFAFGWHIELRPGQSLPFLYRAAGQDQWQSLGPVPAAAGPQVLEVALPLQTLGLALGQDVSLAVTLAQRDAVVAQLPEQGMQSFDLPDFDRAA